MELKLIKGYQAWWKPQDGNGHFWFIYFDNARERTADMNADSFRIVLDILRNEKPVYGDHTTGEVSTQTEPAGEGNEA